eukprot:2443083-Amphidinium_carterae.1
MLGRCRGKGSAQAVAKPSLNALELVAYQFSGSICVELEQFNCNKFGQNVIDHVFTELFNPADLKCYHVIAYDQNNETL